MQSSLISSASRSPRFSRLVDLDVRLALGKVQLSGDDKADAAETEDLKPEDLRAYFKRLDV